LFHLFYPSVNMSRKTTSNIKIQETEKAKNLLARQK